jgi:hypothetical protein
MLTVKMAIPNLIMERTEREKAQRTERVTVPVPHTATTALMKGRMEMERVLVPKTTAVTMARRRTERATVPVPQTL